MEGGMRTLGFAADTRVGLVLGAYSAVELLISLLSLTHLEADEAFFWTD